MIEIVRLLAWPFLLISSSLILALGFAADRRIDIMGAAVRSEVVYFNLSYGWIVLWLFLLERTIPYRPAWRENDGQIGA
ncbi:MAG: hypothetical protein ACREXT_01155, partial [Gammaproteobacteria bacterium]